MKRLLGILIIMVLLISTLGNMASADSLTLLCRVDIGDPASEAGHDVISWGPIEPDAHPTPGSWGGFVTTGENARVIWGHEEGTRCAFVTLDRCINPGAARQIVLRHLDGIYFDYTWEDASFDVFIKDITGNWILMYHYTDQALWSTWVTTAINLDTDIYGNPLDIDEYANVEVQLCATGEMWLHHPSDFGQVAFDWIELWGEQATPPEECGECEGGVTTLTLQYNGTTPADIMVKAKKGDVILFNDTVIPGEMFTFNGADKHGKLGSEIIIFVDGEEYTRIHTSCSQPIGIGMVFGDFVIVAGESLKGGPLCPVPNIPGCGECEGGVTTLTLQYNGTTTADVMVKGKKKDAVLFDGTVSPGEMFTFNGADKHGLNSRVMINAGGSQRF
jgi:hypothetical protein